MTAPTAPTPVANTPPLIGNAPAGGSTDTTNVDSGIDFTYVNLGNQTPPPAKTLVYTPGVRIWIEHDSKQYDVTEDIIACSVSRKENSVSSAAFRLSNKTDPSNPNGGGRYTPLFAPMDRVVIFMKRTEWHQVFSGYLDGVPLLQLYPGQVDFRASCTLKRLLHSWWDPGLPDSAQLFDQVGNASSENENDGQEGLPDKGLGSTLRRVLISVGNWDSTNIHIQRFPLGYYNFMEQMLQKYNGTDQAVTKFKQMILGDDTSLGVGAAAGRQLGVTQGGYSIAGIPARKLEVIRAVDAMGMGVVTQDVGLGQAIHTASTGGKDPKDQQAWQSQSEIGTNYSDAAIKNDAAVQCFMTIYAESSWMMWANPAVPDSTKYPNDGTPPGGGNGTSVGLYQQQNNWGNIDQRMNVAESTGMFLQALAKNDWRNMDRATACQSVQNSGNATGSQYGAFEQTSITEIEALRKGTGTNASGTGPSSVAGIVTSGVAPPAITAGLGGIVGTGIPTTNGAPSGAAALTAAGRPQFDTQGAILFGQTKIGLPYSWGATGPASYDCSGLTQACYKSIGIDIGRTTQDQNAAGQHITMAEAIPGDLLEPADQTHVVMYLGGNMILEAPQQGENVHVVPLYFTPGYVLHFPPAQYGGPGVAAFDPTAMSPGAAPGTVAQGANGGTFQTGSSEPIARNTFTYMFFPGQFVTPISLLFGGGTDNSGSPPEAAFINDEPLIQTIVSLAKAGLRNFQSLPNGDFCAYYPDYFGLDGKDAVMKIEDIELKDAKINWNDDALATHVYVAGTSNPTGASMGVPGWLNTKGIATVENDWLFRRMSAAAPQVKGAEMLNGKALMKRYGVRPLVQSMSNVLAGPMEFLCALQLFMTKWAEQYSTNIETTFMPELYPGMRINLTGHNLQAYVTQVTHSGDFENGFTTSVTIMAPSTPNITRIAQELGQFSTSPQDQNDINGTSSSNWFS